MTEERAMGGTSTGDDQLDDFFSTSRVTGRDEEVTFTDDSYREYLFGHDEEVLAKWRGLDYETFSALKREPDFVQDLLASWQALYDEPFVGVTTDGAVRDVHHLRPVDPDPAPARAAERLLGLLDDDQREAFTHRVDAPEWRAWSNPEFVIHEVGLRLEELDDEVADAVLGMVEASLSPEGYERVAEAMALNGFLGELTDLPALMNERSYWVSLFGAPSADGAWGWQLFGHHVAVNFVSVAGRHVVAPVFLGAEPALSDGARPPLFEARQRLAVDLASSWTPAQRAEAVVYGSVLDPAMPEGRLHPADERHVAGAFRDNRVVPYEGIRASELTDEQWAAVRALVEDFHLLLAAPQRELTMADVEEHRAETHVSWYGATDGSQPFYLRIHSPVVLAELDHHAGVWLNNELPARFHVHTTLRLPNGNDYGRAYLTQLAD